MHMYTFVSVFVLQYRLTIDIGVFMYLGLAKKKFIEYVVGLQRISTRLNLFRLNMVLQQRINKTN